MSVEMYSLIGEYYSTYVLRWWDFRSLQFPDQPLASSAFRLSVKV